MAKSKCYCPTVKLHVGEHGICGPCAIANERDRCLEIVYWLTHDESGLAEGDPMAFRMAKIADKIERKIRRGPNQRLKP